MIVRRELVRLEQTIQLAILSASECDDCSRLQDTLALLDLLTHRQRPQEPSQPFHVTRALKYFTNTRYLHNKHQQFRIMHNAYLMDSQFSANKSTYLENGARLDGGCYYNNYNRKSHAPFRLVPKSTSWMTLNSRYALCCTKRASVEAHHEILNEDRPILYKNVSQ